MLETISIASSSNIQSASYDSEQMTLVIQFTRGAVYEYQQVPGEVVTDLGKALSSGQFFAQNIKGIFPYKKVGG